MATNADERIALAARWLSLFIRPGQVTELRAIKVPASGTVSGWYDAASLDEMARQAVLLSDRGAQGVYFVPNPIRHDAEIPGWRRLGNRVVGRVGEGDATADGHIECRRWLLIDIDPVRAAATNATEEERELAWQALGACRVILEAAGYRRPVVGDSGNGWHLCYPVHWPADEKSRQEHQRVLKELQKRCGGKRVRIDPATYNAARIWKVYGTVPCKGPSTKLRPRRASRIIEEGT